MKIPDNLEFKLECTEATQAYVEKWARKIKPLIEKDGKPHYCEGKWDNWRTAYNWAAVATKEASVIEICRVWTLHAYGYYGFFKPSVAEVILQIPEELLEQTDYWLLKNPNHPHNLLPEELKYFEDGYQVTQTILFKKAE